MVDPKTIWPWIRRGCLLISALGVLWIVSRFRPYGLSGEAHILPIRYEPGQTLLLDIRPRDPVVGDAWLVRTAEGHLALGVVQALQGESLAMLFGRSHFDKEHWIWIPVGDVQARVVMPLPF